MVPQVVTAFQMGRLEEAKALLASLGTGVNTAIPCPPDVRDFSPLPVPVTELPILPVHACIAFRKQGSVPYQYCVCPLTMRVFPCSHQRVGCPWLGQMAHCGSVGQLTPPAAWRSCDTCWPRLPTLQRLTIASARCCTAPAKWVTVQLWIVCYNAERSSPLLVWTRRAQR